MRRFHSQARTRLSLKASRHAANRLVRHRNVDESLDLMRQQDRWKAAASAKIDEGLQDMAEGRFLTIADREKTDRRRI